MLISTIEVYKSLGGVIVLTILDLGILSSSPIKFVQLFLS